MEPGPRISVCGITSWRFNVETGCFVNNPGGKTLVARSGHFLGIVCFALLVFAAQASAQVTGATLTGTITDKSGAVMPNVQVSITNTATGITQIVTSDSAGLYSVPNLIPGAYELTIQAQGFEVIKRTGITLTVGEQLALNVSMAVGTATQTISVSGEPAAIDLTTSTITGTVDDKTVRELPLNGRDWTTLATLEPGVQSLGSVQDSSSVTSFSRGNRGLGFQLSISGARPQLNNYRIDGITVNDYANGGPGSVQGGTLGVDAIQEFSVLTSNYTAEYGRTAGGVINAITRSGTNRIHGSGFEFLRNSALDAANFFDNFNNTSGTPNPKPPFRQNQFGGAVGGPIRKDKTFFFANYEGLRSSLSSTINALVPSTNADQGILNFPTGPTTYPTGCVQTATPDQCAVTVNPLVKPYLPLWAPPTSSIPGGDGNTGIYSFVGKQTTKEDFVTARVDNRFSPADSLYGSMEYDHSRVTLPDAVNDIQNLTISTRVLVAVEETHIFSSAFGNSVRVGYSRSFAEAAPSVPVNPAAGNLALGPATGYGTPDIVVSGLAEAEGAYGIELYNYPYNSYQVGDDAFLTKGKNDLKFGFVVERDQENSLFLPGPSGTFQFSTLANFLTDQPRSIRTGSLNGTRRGWRQTLFGAYVQDNYRYRPNLTFNLGLRYEMSTVLSEIHHHEVSLLNYTDPAPVTGQPLMNNPTLRNFAPRLGMAWDPFKDGTTSVRASFGIFDILPLLSFLSFADNQSAPFNVQGNASNLPPGSFPTTAFSLTAANAQLRTAYIQHNPKRDYAMTWNLSLEHQFAPTLSAFLGYVGSHGVHEPWAVDDMNIVLPTKTPIGYLWPNPVGSGTVLNANGVVSRIDGRFFNNSTTFNGLEAELKKTLGHGFRAQGSYTWSRAIDDGDGINIGDPFTNSISSLFFFDPKLRRGPADFNVTQNLTFNFGYVLPSAKSFSRPVGLILGGWELGGIVTARTGLPFTPNLAGSGNGSNGDPLGLNNSDPFDYPNRITTGNCANPTNPGSVTNYLKLECFTLPTAPLSYASKCATFTGAATPPPPGTVYCSNLLGNLGRNSVIGPRLVDVDFSIFKNFAVPRISETFNVQFRAELFNVLNHVNFNAPIDNSNIFDVTGAPISGAGLIDSTATPAREIQFGLKIIF
jgi:hypothetical protein